MKNFSHKTHFSISRESRILRFAGGPEGFAPKSTAGEGAESKEDKQEKKPLARVLSKAEMAERESQRSKHKQAEEGAKKGEGSYIADLWKKIQGTPKSKPGSKPAPMTPKNPPKVYPSGPSKVDPITPSVPDPRPDPTPTTPTPGAPSAATTGGPGGAGGAGGFGGNINININNTQRQAGQNPATPNAPAAGPNYDEAADRALLSRVLDDYNVQMFKGISILRRDYPRMKKIDADNIPNIKRVRDSVRNFKVQQIAKINKELEEKGSLFRVENSYEGSSNLMWYKIGGPRLNFDGLKTIKQHEAIAEGVRDYIEGGPVLKRNRVSTPQARIAALNAKLVSARISTVKFAVPPVGSALPTIIAGDPSFA